MEPFSGWRKTIGKKSIFNSLSDQVESVLVFWSLVRVFSHLLCFTAGQVVCRKTRDGFVKTLIDCFRHITNGSPKEPKGISSFRIKLGNCLQDLKNTFLPNVIFISAHPLPSHCCFD